MNEKDYIIKMVDGVPVKVEIGTEEAQDLPDKSPVMGSDPDGAGQGTEIIGVNLPEGGGGSEYTAGNGITIENNTIKADVKTIHVNGIKSLTDEQCEVLNPGDVVVDDATLFAYTVTFLEERYSISLVHVTHTEIDEVVYTKESAEWALDVNTGNANLSLFQMVILNGMTGNIEEEDIQKIYDGAFLNIDDMVFLHTYTNKGPNNTTVYHYGGSLWSDGTTFTCAECAITFIDSTHASYVVTVRQVGGGGSFPHYTYLICYDTDGNRHDLTFLCENASISTYDELAEYLINGYFTEGEISSGQHSSIGLPVTDTGYHPVFSMQASADTSSGETSYDIYCYELVISSGEIIRNALYIDHNNSFVIYHLT